MTAFNRKLTSRLLATTSFVFLGASVLHAEAPAATSPPTLAQGAEVQEIVVTAQKRTERLNSVPLTVTAASGATLSNLGITDTRDLGKLVPGFTATETALATPVYTLRGVGFYDSALGATPAVTVYTDQIPLTYPQETRNATFDLQRVEVLKGPQGTLFGQNSTGGAINYIAAKPTDSLVAGADATLGRFNTNDFDFFVGGPITDTLKARAFVEHDGEGNWQQSSTHVGETRGQVNVTKARILVDWDPVSRFHAEFGVSGWVDKSDSQAAQLIGKTPSEPQVPAYYNLPLSPQNDRAADWTPGFPAMRNDSFYLFSLRMDYDLTSQLKLTSLTSYAQLRTDSPIDADGSTFQIDDETTQGSARTFNQEGRIEGNFGGTRVVVGGNFSNDQIHERDVDGVGQAASSLNTSIPGFPVTTIASVAHEGATTYAAFANVEQKLGDRLTIQGGIRYTDDRRTYDNCFQDVGGAIAASFDVLANYVLRPALQLPGVTNIAPNSCITLNSDLQPGPVVGVLHQHNVSWRVGPSFKLTPTTLLYANVSKGYKSGTTPTIFGVSSSEYTPTTQESVLAYEAGVKSGFFGRKLQVNAATFYYDYSDKQFLGITIDPLFGPLQKLLNIPSSSLYGAELEVTANPIRGLSMTAAATFVHSQVDSNFMNFNAYGTPINFKGSPFPYTPKWQGTYNVQYTFPINETQNLFVGGNLTYNDATIGFFGAKVPYNPSEPQHANPLTGLLPTGPIVANGIDIASYILVDLRAGIETADGKLRLTFYGRNIFNKYYWTNATFYPSDSTIRFAGQPATFGATLSYRFGAR